MHTLLGRKTSPESAEALEEKEESRFEVDGTGDESHSWASEYFLCFSDFSNFLITAAAVMVSLVEEMVLSQWYSRKSRSSLVMRLEVCICFVEISKRRGRFA